MGYSLIYKGYDRKVNELPIRDMTLTLVRHSYPRGLMKALREDGYTVEERHPGIYRIAGGVSNLNVQVIVSSRLPASGCRKESIVRYAQRAAASHDGNVKTNAETVIGICLDINRYLDKELKEDEAMYESVREIFKDAFDAAEQKGRQAGIQEGILAGRQEGVSETSNRVATDMLRKELPLSLIAEISRLSEDTIRSIARSLSLTTH